MSRAGASSIPHAHFLSTDSLGSNWQQPMLIQKMAVIRTGGDSWLHRPSAGPICCRVSFLHFHTMHLYTFWYSNERAKTSSCCLHLQIFVFQIDHLCSLQVLMQTKPFPLVGFVRTWLGLLSFPTGTSGEGPQIFLSGLLTRFFPTYISQKFLSLTE